MNMTKLPINLNDLLRQRTVEGDRIEYKAGWNPDPIIRTVCPRYFFDFVCRFGHTGRAPN
mgnify:CR=1 FL=1